MGYALGLEIRKSLGLSYSIQPKEEQIENKENCKPKSMTSSDKNWTQMKKEKVLE